ncbi:unnamed protein product, partial [Tilletia laevis]
MPDIAACLDPPPGFGLLDPVAVVDVDVYVEDAGVDAEELEDAEDDVIDVAET